MYFICMLVKSFKYFEIEFVIEYINKNNYCIKKKSYFERNLKLFICEYFLYDNVICFFWICLLSKINVLKNIKIRVLGVIYINKRLRFEGEFDKWFKGFLLKIMWKK